MVFGSFCIQGLIPLGEGEVHLSPYCNLKVWGESLLLECESAVFKSAFYLTTNCAFL